MMVEKRSKINEGRKILTFALPPAENCDSLECYFTDILDESMAKKTKRILVDARKVAMPGSTMSIFALGQCIANKMVGSKMRMAVVMESINATSSDFLETVVKNRGGNLRIFVNAETANKWLMKTH
jgi:hypothetical protein